MDDRERLRRELAFFGKVTASISHEINNVVTVVGEVGGLLHDMALMAERGRPLDAEKVRRECERVAGQVARGKEIIKSLNRFAHSTDDPTKTADLVETTAQSVRLFQRFAELRRTSIELAPTAEPVTVTADLFGFNHVFFLAVLTLLDAGDSAEPVRVSIASAPDGAEVRFARTVDGAAPVALPQDALDRAADAGFEWVDPPDGEPGTIKFWLRMRL